MKSELNDLLIRHIEKSDNFQDEVIKKLSSIETHQSYTTERLDKVEGIAKDYEKHRNIIYGSIISLSAIWGFFEFIYNKITK